MGSLSSTVVVEARRATVPRARPGSVPRSTSRARWAGEPEQPRGERVEVYRVDVSRTPRRSDGRCRRGSASALPWAGCAVGLLLAARGDPSPPPLAQVGARVRPDGLVTRRSPRRRRRTAGPWRAGRRSWVRTVMSMRSSAWSRRSWLMRFAMCTSPGSANGNDRAVMSWTDKRERDDVEVGRRQRVAQPEAADPVVGGEVVAVDLDVADRELGVRQRLTAARRGRSRRPSRTAAACSASRSPRLGWVRSSSHAPSRFWPQTRTTLPFTHVDPGSANQATASATSTGCPP
jgi:hypothetical protein